MTTIDTSLLLSSYQSDRKTGDSLGKDDFLKLLLTQLQNQDPSSPMDNTEFIAQMATFSSLEQMMNIGSQIDELIGLNQQNSLMNYNSFVGKEVTWHILDESGENLAIEEGVGIVESIQYKGDNIYFILEDGTKLQPANISAMKQSSTTSNSLTNASELIGKRVTWNDEENGDLSAVVTSVSMNKGKVQIEVDDQSGTKLSLDQLIKIASA
ncbi:flagellar hook assembly protein FlgD [Peribacillus butanolivorans]|uniref:flagellar hook assembly protein FlgD n=1 Tax=Peribacillus TaxID=2675229 RepID=UPI001911FF53|nr:MULTISPECIES: flagellar hook assembly protein FlgD [unclassified Peribacillus]MBK5459375.1 flagellar hook assembly protein FlgD [Peribacillus sp. TH27]MBK5481179.1 flagellar hook assembly protein FlgD [Peribacillus sp. TH16]MBK5497562.1 flagellar hook assembly protein FlgD [Peribacillus sp. TH14]